jgi:hypothetical protein
MERQTYFNNIESRLAWLVSRIELRGRLNILDLNILAEDFFIHFLNLLFDWHLENQNAIKQNFSGIDLIDHISKNVIQVSATTTKQKVESALASDLSGYDQYVFKFIAITNDASKLKAKTFNNPHKLKFDPVQDIYDIKVLLDHIKSLDIEKTEAIDDLLKKEIKIVPETNIVESNLAKIIDIFSQIDWGTNYEAEKIPFDIDKKIEYNEINSTRPLIDDYKRFYHRIDKIYEEFDMQGNNKSLSVLNNLRSIYFKNANIQNADECLLKIIDIVIINIKQSSNYIPIIDEELRMCIEIIVVDAFIRCKIFRNPEEYSDVITR